MRRVVQYVNISNELQLKTVAEDAASAAAFYVSSITRTREQ